MITILTIKDLQSDMVWHFVDFVSLSCHRNHKDNQVIGFYFYLAFCRSLFGHLLVSIGHFVYLLMINILPIIDQQTAKDIN